MTDGATAAAWVGVALTAVVIVLQLSSDARADRAEIDRLNAKASAFNLAIDEQVRSARAVMAAIASEAREKTFAITFVPPFRGGARIPFSRLLALGYPLESSPDVRAAIEMLAASVDPDGIAKADIRPDGGGPWRARAESAIWALEKMRLPRIAQRRWWAPWGRNRVLRERA